MVSDPEALELFEEISSVLAKNIEAAAADLEKELILVTGELKYGEAT